MGRGLGVTWQLSTSQILGSRTNVFTLLWTCHIQLKLWPFCDIFAYFGQNLVLMTTSLRPFQSEISSLDWSTTKNPLISSRILVMYRTNAFICIIAILVPKLVATVTPLCCLCTAVSHMNSRIPQTLYLKTRFCMNVMRTAVVVAILPATLRTAQRAGIWVTLWPTLRFSPRCTDGGEIWHGWTKNQTLHGRVADNWSYAVFCDFWLIFAKMWLPWHPPLDPFNQKCLLWIGRPRKPPVISSRVLVVVIIIIIKKKDLGAVMSKWLQGHLTTLKQWQNGSATQNANRVSDTL